MTDYQAGAGRRSGRGAALERMRGHAEDVFLENCRGDDFIGVQTYSRTRVAADANLGAEDGVPVAGHGLRVLPAGAEPPPSAGPGR